jgi:hypothetical protein
MNEEAESKERAIARPCLIALLNAELALVGGLHWPLRGFTVGETRYGDAGYGDWTGFYDWLRSPHGRVLGVRYCLQDYTEFLLGYTEKLAYVLAKPSHYIEVYFSDEREFDPRVSDDQDFLYSAIFRSSDGSYAIAFGAEDLQKSAQQNLAGMEVRWRVASAWE